MARYGATDGCTACADIRFGKSRASVKHSSECRARIEELMQRDEDAVVQERLRRDRLKRDSATEAKPPGAGGAVGAATPPRVEPPRVQEGGSSSSVGPAGPLKGGRRRGLPEVGRDRRGNRTVTQMRHPIFLLNFLGAEAAQRAAPKRKTEEPRGTKRSSELAGHEPDDESRAQETRDPGEGSVGEIFAVQGEHLDSDVSLAAPTTSPRNSPGIDAADADMSAGKLDLVPKAAPKIAGSAAATTMSMTSLDVWELAKVGVELAVAKVAEIYSPARFTSVAGNYGLRPGFFIDMTAEREDGRHWDLRSADDQARLKRLQEEERPELFIGSPPCTSFCPLLRLSKSAEQVAEQQIEGKEHIRISIEAYERQLAMGKHFLHEHPAHSSSWKMPEVTRLASNSQVYIVQGPMCRWEMASKDNSGVEGFVRKETKWMTSSARLAQLLQGRCNGECRHVPADRGWQGRRRGPVPA